MTSNSRKPKFCCTESMCTAFFLDQQELWNHEQEGNHVYATPRSSMDQIREYFVQQKHIEKNNTINQATDLDSIYLSDVEAQTFEKTFKSGWSRPVRRHNRFSERQKNFIRNLFEAGEKTKKKMSSEDMAKKMKEHTINGQYYFDCNECLTPTQIKGLIKRCMIDKQAPSTSKSAKKRKIDDEVTETGFNFDEVRINIPTKKSTCYILFLFIIF